MSCSPPSFPFSFPPSLLSSLPPLYLPPSIGSPRVRTSWLLWSRRRLRAWEDKTMCALDTSLCCEMLWPFFLPDSFLSLNNAWSCFQCVFLLFNVLQYPVRMLFFSPLTTSPSQGFIQEPWESPPQLLHLWNTGRLFCCCIAMFDTPYCQTLELTHTCRCVRC